MAVGLPIAAALLLLTASMAVERIAAVAVPTAIHALDGVGGFRIAAGRVSAPSPLQIVVHDVTATRSGTATLRARRVRIDVSLTSLLRGQVAPDRVVAEGIAGSVSYSGVELEIDGGFAVANHSADGWKARAEGFIAGDGSATVPFRASYGDGTARMDFSTPLTMPVPGLDGGVRVLIFGAALDGAAQTVTLQGVGFDGLPDDVRVEVATVEAPLPRSGGSGSEEPTVRVNGLRIDATVDGLRELARRLRPRPSKVPGEPRRGPSQDPRPSLPVAIEATDAELALRTDDVTVAIHGASVGVSTDGGIRLAARIPHLGPEATAQLTTRRVDPPKGAPEGTVTVRFDVAIEGGRLQHAAISPRPLQDLRGRLAGTASWQSERSRLELDVEAGEVRGARFGLRAHVERLALPGKPRVALALDLPEQDCQALADAVPAGVFSRVQHPKLTGTYAGGLRFSVDMADIEGTIELEGHGDPAQCEVASLGPNLDLEALNGPFVHRWERSDGGEPIEVGPGTPGYVSLDDVPAHVARSMIVTEDGRFWRHNGINLGLIKRALRINLTKGRFVYGGSTITQQLVKNLFLNRNKTLARKLEEALVGLQLERVVDKHRILELYVNVIEFGPDVYGIGQASAYYYASRPAHLTPIEGAFLAAIKPQPSAGPRLARRGHFKGWWHHRLIEVMRWLEEGGYITPLERANAFPYYPTFDGSVTG